METELSANSSIRKKSKGGRPRLPDAELRDRRMLVSLTDAELDQLVARAERAGMGGTKWTRAEFARRAMLNLPIKSIPQVNKDVLVSLSKIGSNIEQMRKLGYENQAADLSGIKEAISALYEIALNGVGSAHDNH